MISFCRKVRTWINAPLLDRIAQAQLVFVETRHLLAEKLTRLEVDLQRVHIFEEGPAGLGIAGWVARSERLRAEIGMLAPTFAPARSIPFEESLRRLEALNPRLFPIWHKLFENGAKSYVEEWLGSCSHREQRYARLFGHYLEIYGHGRILDIGCGPYGLAYYLTTRNPALVCGLEPLPQLGHASFEIARGFNEFLPWDDGQFDTVVSGTSLDHVMSLDVSLAEVRRVLKPNGRYIVWLASIPGAKPFDEKATVFEPIDKLHLFHFDKAWIEPIFEEKFFIEDVAVISQPGFDHMFYCMRPKRQG